MDSRPVSETKSDSQTVAPWSLKPKRLGLGSIMAVGAGSLIAAFYIGTADISIATKMGANFGYNLWWTYFVLGLAGWALIDMSVRYFLRFGKTPVSIFKDVHWTFAGYLFLTIIVCTIFGSFGQWNACAMVLTGFFPGLPLEVGGGLAALAAMIFVMQGVYGRLEKGFVVVLLLLIAAFFGSALLADADWGAAARGLAPRLPEGAMPLFAANAGSMINAWLILIYPYTMIEKRWYSDNLQEKVNILHRVRVDYAWGILAAAVVALPIMAASATIARPFGMKPEGYMDFAILLEPLAGRASTHLFLAGLFAAAWTSGVAWWLGGAYALMDLFNLPTRMDAKPFRVAVALFFVPSVAMLGFRFSPVYLIVVFSIFLSLVFPVIGVVMAWRISRRDMEYFGWSLRSARSIAIVAVDLFAVGLSLYVGAAIMWTKLLGPLLARLK